MKYFLFIFFTTTFFKAASQKIIGPSWDTQNVYFETAKIKKSIGGTSTYSKEEYKTAFIKIENIDLGKPDFTIDIPDLYFGKSFYIKKVSYNLDYGESEYFSYILISTDEKDMVGLTIYYSIDDSTPISILVSVYKDYSAKSSKKISFILSEFK